MEQTWGRWKKDHGVIQTINLLLAFALVALMLIGIQVGQINPLNLGICALLSLWASMTESKRTLYMLNFIIAVLLIFGSIKLNYGL